MKKKYPFVIVDWTDACSRAGWMNEGEISDFIKDKAFETKNAGWLVRETKDFLMVAARISFADDMFGLVEKLPKRMVKRIRRIRV